MKHYKRVNQLGFVVNDLDKALRDYAEEYGIRQWYRAGKKPTDPMKWHGEAIKDEGFDLIIGYCGKTEIELIKTTADSSLYADFLKEGNEGLHHVSLFVLNLKKAIRHFEKMGYEIVQEGCMHQSLGTTAPYAYMKKPGSGWGDIVELQTQRMFGFIPFTRNRFNLWVGHFLPGMAEPLNMRKIRKYKG